MPKLGCPIRSVFILLSVLIWLGIYLTGFGNIHWLLYLPAAITAFAGITGICPGAIIAGKICK